MDTEMTDPITEQQHQAPPPPPRPGWRHTPLSRMPKGGEDGGRLGGVVAGISRAYGFDLHTTRIATVIAMLVLPVLVLVYLAAWVLLPATPAQAVPIQDVFRDRRRMPLLVAIGLVIVLGGLGSLGSWFLFRGAPWGLVLIGLGVLLWVLSRDRRDDPPRPGHGSVAGSTAIGTSAFPPPTGAAAGTTTSANDTTATTRVPVARRPRRPIGSIGLGVAVLWCVLVSALEALGWWHPQHLWILFSAIAIVMVSLLVSTLVNHSWVLPAPFLLLAVVLVGLGVTQPHLEGGSGQRTAHPATVEAAQQTQRLAAGQLTIDLHDLPLGSSTVQVRADVGFGQLHVLVPSDATLQVTTDVGAGQAIVNGQPVAEGVRQRDSRTVIGTAGTIVLDLRIGIGEISVERVP